MVSASLWPHRLQHARLPNSWSLLKLMSIESVMPPNISSSVIPFSFCLQSFPASGSFPMSQFFASGDQIIGVSASALILQMTIQNWFLLRLTCLISLLLQHHSLKASILWHSTFFMVQLSHPYMTTGKTIALTVWTLVSKVMSLLLNILLNILSKFVSVSS